MRSRDDVQRRIWTDRRASTWRAPISGINLIAHDGQRYNVVTTTEGEVGVVVPISGEDYMVLLSLQKYIVDSLPQIAALNPDNYR